MENWRVSFRYNINNNPYTNCGWQDPFKFPKSPMLKYKFSDIDFCDEIKVDKEGKKLAVEWILNNPDKFLKLGFIKLKRVVIIHDRIILLQENFLKDPPKHNSLIQNIIIK